jgi:hypothetical protein
MKYNNINSNKSFLFYETYDDTMYGLNDAPDISNKRLHKRLPGDWPVSTKKSITKKETISELIQYFDVEQAVQFFNILPTDEWIKCKQYLRSSDIYKTVKETIERLEIRLKKYDSRTLKEIYNWQDSYDAEDAENIANIFKCPPTKENIENITGEYIADITLIILCYAESQWKRRNTKIDSIVYDEVFPIPFWLKMYLPLFSGVAEDKFGRDRGFFDNLEFTTQKDQYIIKIDYLGITYLLSLDKSSLEKYYFGKLKDENFKTVENFLRSLMNEAFSPKGLRYLLAIFLSFEENGRQIEIEERMADFFKRLNAKKTQIKDDEKEDFLKILFVFSNVYKVTEPIINVKEKNVSQRKAIFFSYSGDEFKIGRLGFDLKVNDIRNFRLRLKLNKTYFNENKYAILPKAIVKEGIGEDNLIFFLMTNLALHWVATEDIVISVKDFITRCGLNSYAEDDTGSNDVKKIIRLEKTLENLRKNSYIGEWITVKKESSSKKEKKKSKSEKIKYPIILLKNNAFKGPYRLMKQNPSELLVDKQWLECSIHIVKPNWLSRKSTNYKDKHYYRLSKLEQNVYIYSGSETREFRKINNMEQKDLAKRLGIKAPLLCKIEKMNFKLNKELNEKFIKIKTEIENK